MPASRASASSTSAAVPWRTTVQSPANRAARSSTYGWRTVASVPSTPITRVRLSAAAGLIAGTVPTTGTSSAARTAPSAIVDAVLQAMTISRGA